jgi:hypothetical protein
MYLSESTFVIYAAKYYDNPHCSDVLEFEEDLKRFQYLRKLFGRFSSSGELKERLILNHLIVIYNCFGLESTNMLFMKLEGYHEYLKPFVAYLSYLPEHIQYENKMIRTRDIESNQQIERILNEL